MRCITQLFERMKDWAQRPSREQLEREIEAVRDDIEQYLELLHLRDKERLQRLNEIEKLTRSRDEWRKQAMDAQAALARIQADQPQGATL